ncbi:MAG: hypothetical protein WC640_00395 [Candidatus Paceibacterota bacterium]|jgi:lysyl-tRNA synthetase class I
MRKPECYLYLSGLKKVATKMSGQETIHLGIRPYGFHAGNALALYVYPYLLCRELKKMGKKARLTLIYSLNDYEQDEIDSPNKNLYPFNLKPKYTTFQFLPSGECPEKTMIELWAPRIRENIKRLLIDFPELNIRYINNSWLKEHPTFKKLLLKTLTESDKLSDIFRKYTDKIVLANAQYASAVCKKCFCARNKTTIDGNEIFSFLCPNCHQSNSGKFNDFDYWWYHKPLFLARMEIFKPDLTISGGDHYNEGDYEVRQAMAEAFVPGKQMPDMLFTPVLLAPDGKRMSKSQGNARYGKIDEIIKIAEKFDTPEILCPEQALSFAKNYEEYCFSF